MKQTKLAIFIIPLFLIVLAGCGQKVEKTEEGTTTTNNKLITDDITYSTDDSDVTIRRNKITKVASIEMTYKIKDDEEYTDFMDEKVTMVPYLVNMTCSLFNSAIFDPKSLEGLTNGEQQKTDDKMDNYLVGYTTNKITMTFVDAETAEKIVTCESTKSGTENIHFDIFKDYSSVSSFFGVKMGVYEKAESPISPTK